MVQGSNPGVGEISCSHPDRPWSPPSLLYNGYRVSFPGVKRLGRGVDHPPPSSARVKERVELYLYSPSGLTWPVLGRTLPFSLTITAMFWPDKFCHIKYLSLWFAVQVLTTSIIGCSPKAMWNDCFWTLLSCYNLFFKDLSKQKRAEMSLHSLTYLTQHWLIAVQRHETFSSREPVTNNQGLYWKQ